MIKKQTLTALIIAGAVLIAGLLYAFVLAPWLESRNLDEEGEIQELIEGEIRGLNDRILIFEHVEKADIQSVEVNNEYGTYTMARDDDGNFVLKEYETAPYSLEMLSNLVVSAGYPLAMTRVAEGDVDFAEYGLADDDHPASYLLTKTDGTEYRLYVGHTIPTGAGYYVRYPGRDAVYILDTSIALTLLAPMTDLVTPVLGYPLTSSDYYSVDDFYIMEDNEIKVMIDYLTDEEKTAQAATSAYRMLKPAQYVVNVTNYCDILYKMVTLTGNEVVYLEKTGTPMPDEMLRQYGIDTETIGRMLHYTYSGVESIVVFGEPDENGRCYAYSALFNMIVSVDRESVDFMWWDVIRFVDRMTFSLYLNDVASIAIESEDYTETFEIEGEGTDITVYAAKAGHEVEDVQNFRQFYKSLLSVYLEDYAEVTDPTDLDCMAAITVTTDAGVVYEYRYYPYSTRRCFYTVNGEGQYYVFRDSVAKVLSDAEKAEKGIPVDSDAKN